MKPKVVVVLGARPQFVKHAAVHQHLSSLTDEILVHTGQHYDAQMSDAFFQQLDLGEPKYDLGVGSGSHGVQTAAILRETESVLDNERPNMVLVYGDTNSTLAATLAAVKLRIPVAHVEAGVRNNDLSIPEEVNRVLTDRVSQFLFCPTQTAAEYLRVEGLADRAFVTGDVMLDIFLGSKTRALQAGAKLMSHLGLKEEGYLLVTLHRPSNVDDPDDLENVLKTLCKSGRTVVFPAHPRTSKVMRDTGLMTEFEDEPNLKLVEPLDYLSFIGLAYHSAGIVTDSGGVQKEAYFMGVPCTTIFDETPWPETLQGGWNVTTGQAPDKILQAIGRSRPNGLRGQAFGDGRAGVKVTQIIAQFLGKVT